MFKYLRLNFIFWKILAFGKMYFADEKGGSDSGDDQHKTDKNDDSKKTDKTFDQDSIQHGINIATAKHKKEIEAIQKELAELRKFRDDKELEKAEAEQKELEKKQEYQKIIEKNLKSFEEKETKYKQQIGTYESDLRRLIIESEIAKVAPEIKVIPEAMQDFIKITSPLMGYEKVEIDGRIDYKVYPSNNGNPLINEKGQEMSIKEFLEKFIEDKSYFKQALAQSGSGSKGGRSAGQQITNSRDAIHVGLQKLYKGK